MAIVVRTCRVLLERGVTGYIAAACAQNIDAQLKISIAEDIIPGPRIRACSHHIGTTADLNDSPTWWRTPKSPGLDLFADGPEALRRQVREEIRSEEHTSELQSLIRISYADFCLKKQQNTKNSHKQQI